ncbi:hypothetical protein [Paenibacillus sp. URB8-2]|uniref:hypothetical protein n=1 Tax=Paenibacillus sp. URB8-2 TaxID=2741301 RepID=UPI0015C1B69C|nr:hypothetical protein [Paenibacillus sp. URB8-2]
MEYITSFIAMALTFGLLYFNAPYWCGKEMFETSKNGLWRWYYLLLSKIGHLFYQLCEKVSKYLQTFLFKKMKLNISRRHPIWSNLINLFVYIGAVFFLTQVYDKICGYFVINDNANFNTLASGNEGILTELQTKVSFFRIVVEVNELNGGHFDAASIFVSVVFVIAMWALLIFINTLYFSIIYGLLKEKLIEVNFLLKRNRVNQKVEEEAEKEQPTLKNLLSQIENKIREWAASQTVISNIYHNIKVLLAFIPILFAFSSIMYVTGNYKVPLRSIAWELFDSIGLVNILISFAITWLSTKAAQKTGAYAISIAPAGVQNLFENLSERAGRKAESYEDNRRRWAENNDWVRNEQNGRNEVTEVDRRQGKRELHMQEWKQSHKQSQKNRFDNEPEARGFLEKEFRMRYGDFTTHEFDKAIELLFDYIAPCLRSSNSFSRINSYTPSSIQIITVANFCYEQPEHLEHVSHILDRNYRSSHY